jgi:hypothetical protein
MAEPYVLGIITAEQAVALWPQIEKLLAPILAEEGCFLPIDVLSQHIRGEMLIWVAWDTKSPEIDAVMVTQILRFPRKIICGIPYICGKNMKAWEDRFIAESERHAKAAGASQMSGGFREGWVKVAGYKKVGCMLRKNL